MLTGSIFSIFPFDFKPSAPSSGKFIIYAKTDNIIYLQDSSGIEYAFASSSMITQLSGEATAIGPGNAVVTLSNSAVIGKILTGFIAGPNSPVLATDTILQAFQKLQAQVSATGGSAITQLTGDVSASGPGSVAATVNSIGGSSAANVHAAELLANAATSANTASAIVRRDASGNFSANQITAATFVGNLTGNVTGNVSGSSSSFTGSLSGDVTGTQSSTVVSSVGGSSAANIHSAELAANAATPSNTINTIVKRDASGNFSANQITAAIFVGNLTGNASGTASNITGLLAISNGGTNSATALSNNRIMVSVSGAIVEASAIAAHRAIVSNANGLPIASATTDAEIVFVSGVTSSIQSQFNSITGSAITSLTGDGTATGPGASVFTLTNSAVTGQLLTGYAIGSNTLVLATDSILQAIEKLQGQVSYSVGSAITALTGDVSASGPGSVAATVNSIGGSSAVNVHSAELLANAATSANSAITIVRRDASGNFAASAITISSFSSTGISDIVQGIIKGFGTQTNDIFQILKSDNTVLFKVTNAGSGTFSGNLSALNFSGSSSGTNTGDVTKTDTDSIAISLSGQNISATLKLSSDSADAGNLKATSTIHSGAGAGLHVEYPFGAPVQIGTSNNAGSALGFALFDHVHSHGNQTVATLHAIATGSANGFMSSTDKTKLDAATDANTASTLVMRDASGNFSASQITANITGNVSGSAASFTGSLSGDVTGTQSATAISSSTVTGKLLTGFSVGANTAILAADTILAAFGKTQGQINAISGSAITALTDDVVATGPGSVSAAISVGAVTDTKASLAVKPAVTVVATTNQTLSGTPTIDGQTTIAGTSIALLTAQTTGSENGPWIVQSGAWTRPTWYPTAGTTQSFQFITTFVRLGTVYGGSTWRQTAAAPITIGTTTTTWVVTPIKGNFNSIYTIGPQTGSSAIDLIWANANTGTLRWNPTSSHILILPPTQGAAGTSLTNDGAGNLSWSNLNTNIDGGRPDSVYTPSQFLNGGSP